MPRWSYAEPNPKQVVNLSDAGYRIEDLCEEEER
jgi:hypothetical protein